YQYHDGPSGEYETADHHQRGAKTVLVGEGFHQERARGAGKPAAAEDDTHGLAALQAEPVRDDQLVRDGSGEQVTDGVEDPQRVVNQQLAAHVGRSRERHRGDGGADEDELARAEA